MQAHSGQAPHGGPPNTTGHTAVRPYAWCHNRIENFQEIAPNKQQEAKKLVVKNLEKRMVIDKVWSAQNQSEALNLLRHIIAL